MLELARKLGLLIAIARREILPASEKFRAARANAFRETLHDAIRNIKFAIGRPAVSALRCGNFTFTKRLAMRFLCVLLVRRAVGDVAAHDDERWHAFRG